MGQQDLGYKRVFAHREMVEDLLRGFVREPWVAEVEMDSLERVSGSYVSDDLRAREDDIIWRVRWRDRWLYVYLLLEFQATVDSFMALRILVYVGLLYQDLLRENKLTRLENSRAPEDIIQVLELLIEWLQAPEQAELARALVVWLRRSLLASRMPDIDIPEIENLQEARTMLAERVKDWKKQWQEEARKEGESTVLIKLLTRKFGALAPDIRQRILDASSDQLLNWAERLLTADTIDEVFG